MSELDEKAKRHRRMSLMRFHAEFCTAAGNEAYAGEPDAHELELRDFVKLILAGVEQGDVPIWGMDAAAGMQAMRQYLKGVEYGQTYTWIASGDSEPEYVKRGAHSLPELLHLEMFTLERIEVAPVLLLEWMREREDTAALLRDYPRHEATIAAKDAEVEQSSAAATALPEVGFLRLAEVLPLVGVSRSNWYRGVQSGEFPCPVKLGKRAAGYRVQDIRDLLERLSRGEGVAHE